MEKISLDQLLPYLYLDKLEEKEDYYTACCPVHKEKHPSFVIYKNTYHCRCFSCGYNNSIFDLIKDLNGKSANSLLGINNNFKNYLFDKPIQNKVNKKVIHNKNKIIKLYGEIKEVFSNNEVMSYLNRKNITNKFITDFKIKYFNRLKIDIIDKESNNIITRNFKNRLLIPIAYKNKIINYELRDYTGTSKKKVLYVKSCPLNILFNIDNLDRDKPLLLTEGIFDLSFIYNYISTNCTSVLGISLTNRQIDFLNEFKEIVLFPDNDERGEGFISKLYEVLERDFYIAKIKNFSDPGESSLENLNLAYKSKIISSEYFINKYKIFENNNILY